MAYEPTDGAHDPSQGAPDTETGEFAPGATEYAAERDAEAGDQSWSYYDADDQAAYQQQEAGEGDGAYGPVEVDDAAYAEAMEAWSAEDGWDGQDGTADDADEWAEDGDEPEAGYVAQPLDGEVAYEQPADAYPERPAEAVYAFDDESAAANEAQADGYDLYADEPAEPAQEDELATPAPEAAAGQQDETQVLPPIAAGGYVPVTRPDKLAQYHAVPRQVAPAPYQPQDHGLASLLEEDPEAEAAYRALVSRREDRKRRRRIYAVVAAVAVLTAVAVFALRDRFVPQQGDELDYAPALYTVARENFTSTVQSSGALQPASSVVVTPEVAGIISEVRVKEGDAVKEGDVLFVLKNDDVTKAVSDADDQLKSAQATATNAANSVTSAYNAYNTAVDAYNTAIAAGQQPEAIDEVGLRAAITTAEAARDSANSAVTAARATLDEANKQADKLTVKAPISGDVVSLGAVVGAAVGGAAGATAQATSSTLAQIADVSQMKVTVQVNEIDISSIAPGQTAKVTFSAISDLELGATVESIASVASGAGEGDFGGGGIVTYGVVLVITEPDAKLKPGMTANVTITTQDVPDALVVPLSAVVEGPTGATVEVLLDEETMTTEQRNVTLGARGTTDVVVTEGLSEGDVILLANTGALDVDEGDLSDAAVMETAVA